MCDAGLVRIMQRTSDLPAQARHLWQRERSLGDAVGQRLAGERTVCLLSTTHHSDGRDSFACEIVGVSPNETVDE